MVAEVGYYNAWLVLGPVYQNNLLHTVYGLLTQPVLQKIA